VMVSMAVITAMRLFILAAVVLSGVRMRFHHLGFYSAPPYAASRDSAQLCTHLITTTHHLGKRN
jgi:hypothetical protein